MPWDQYNYTATPWAEIPKTIDEVGSIYTCQWFDLNYAGIIIGPPISQIPDKNKIRVNLDKITDIEMFKKRKDLSDPHEIKTLEEEMVLNSAIQGSQDTLPAKEPCPIEGFDIETIAERIADAVEFRRFIRHKGR